MKVGEGGLRGLRREHRATAQHRNLIMAECVLFCCLHPRVNSANIRKGRRVAWLSHTGWRIRIKCDCGCEEERKSE